MSQYYACPKCGSDDFGDKISGGDFEQDGDAIWKSYECACGFEWTEIYYFSHNEAPDALHALDNKGNEICPLDKIWK